MTALVLNGPALAQTTTPELGGTEQTSDQPAPTVAKPGPKVRANGTSAQDGETIVVTGSRIRQPEFSSPDPVSLIDPVTAIRAGKLDTSEMLQSSSIAAGSTQITSTISSNFVTNGGQGAQTIDLRGLGPNRTLVLLNGRRAGAADPVFATRCTSLIAQLTLTPNRLAAARRECPADTCSDIRVRRSHE